MSSNARSKFNSTTARPGYLGTLCFKVGGAIYCFHFQKKLNQKKFEKNNRVTNNPGNAEIFNFLIKKLILERLRSPNPSRNSMLVEKDEGISDEEDTTELKLQLELNERVRLCAKNCQHEF